MGTIKEKWSAALYKIRNPEYDERETQYHSDLKTKRLLILIPFIIAAVIFLLLSLNK